MLRETETKVLITPSQSNRPEQLPSARQTPTIPKQTRNYSFKEGDILDSNRAPALTLRSSHIQYFPGGFGTLAVTFRETVRICGTEGFPSLNC